MKRKTPGKYWLCQDDDGGWSIVRYDGRRMGHHDTLEAAVLALKCLHAN